MNDLFADILYEVGEIYNRRDDIHGRFAGQQQGGIATPSSYPLIFLFSSGSGSDFGYKDEFKEDGTFWYTGEGQEGDMKMKRGNEAIRTHRQNSKDLHLFEAIGSGQARYIGEAEYLDHHIEKRPDINDEFRDAIVFELVVDTTSRATPSDRVEQPTVKYDTDLPLRKRSLDELREIALSSSAKSVSSSDQRKVIHRRSEAIKEYALKRADGKCEGCLEEAPFKNSKGLPFLEVHHTRRVSDGGPDHPKWVAALCPNCHRKVHHGKNGENYNSRIEKRIRAKETT